MEKDNCHYSEPFGNFEDGVIPNYSSKVIQLHIYTGMSEIYEKSNISAIIVDLFVRHEKQFKDPPLNWKKKLGTKSRITHGLF